MALLDLVYSDLESIALFIARSLLCIFLKYLYLYLYTILHLKQIDLPLHKISNTLPLVGPSPPTLKSVILFVEYSLPYYAPCLTIFAFFVMPNHLYSILRSYNYKIKNR